MYGAKLNISCTGLMDGSPNYGMKAMYFPEKGCHLGTNRSDNET